MRNQKTSICFLLVVLLLDTFGNGMIQAQTSNDSTASSNLTAADRTDLQRQLATLESTIKELAARSDPKIKSLLARRAALFAGRRPRARTQRAPFRR